MTFSANSEQESKTHKIDISENAMRFGTLMILFFLNAISWIFSYIIGIFFAVLGIFLVPDVLIRLKRYIEYNFITENHFYLDLPHFFVGEWDYIFGTGFFLNMIYCSIFVIVGFGISAIIGRKFRIRTLALLCVSCEAVWLALLLSSKFYPTPVDFRLFVLWCAIGAVGGCTMLLLRRTILKARDFGILSKPAKI